ncbi:biliverdin-producing heme oxygenase [Roseospira goensis]|uniref:Heme oxygenase n=1 Tax=Roseospira goensis TaxID=391922 RepID=A0A7W6S1B9_9PROT|nr:biliverdin-producing heme oxygenase [Roseospira goensis]MBB4286377.1 heme oxygenase [Roseospira goensis]
MTRLRAATREPHEALHRAALLAPLQAPRLEAARYGRILARFDAFLTVAETQVLIPADPWLARQGFARASRRPALAADLADLARAGVTPTADPPAPPAIALPSGPGAALGVLYVTEGSRLGGRGLARHLAGALPAPVAGATRFLGSPEVDLATHWRRVGAVIDTAGRDPGHAAAALEAARRAFALLHHWFDERP